MKHLVQISMIEADGEPFALRQIMTYQKIGSWVVFFHEEGATEIKVEILKYNMTKKEIVEHENSIKPLKS